jgi:hypothetical protein
MSFRTKTIVSATVTMMRNSVIFRENSASDFVQASGATPKATQRRRPAERAAVAIRLRVSMIQSPQMTGLPRVHDLGADDSYSLPEPHPPLLAERDAGGFRVCHCI